MGNRRRGIDDLMGASPGDEEVGVVEFQGIGFGYKFLSKEFVEEFQFLKIIA